MIEQKVFDRYAKHIVDNYYSWRGNRAVYKDAPEMPFNVSFEPGSKYIRVVTDSHGHRSSHSFIATANAGKWPEGTILKCASWKAPAQNFARGNIFDETHPRVTWTGAI
jgi:hypothetical protein